MAYEELCIVQEWLDGLKALDVSVKKMFGCYCLYCDGQAVGWIHDSVMSLREVGLDYLPDNMAGVDREALNAWKNEILEGLSDLRETVRSGGGAGISSPARAAFACAKSQGLPKAPRPIMQRSAPV